MSRIAVAVIALLVVLLIFVDSSLFTVDQTQQVLITQFGDPVKVITAPSITLFRVR